MLVMNAHIAHTIFPTILIWVLKMRGAWSFKLLVAILAFGFLFSTAQSEQEITNGQCGGTIELDRGSLTFPDEGVITAGQLCIWTIHLPTRNGFRINFTDVNIPSDDSVCSESSLRVTSLSNLIVGDLETISVCNGNPSTRDHFLNGNTLAVVFRTADNWQEDGRTKFVMNWEGSFVQPNPPVHTSTFTTTSSGIVRHPIDGEYPPNTVVTWLVQPRSPSTATEINVENPNFEWCSLEDHCYCDALIIYEVTIDGFVRDVQRFCGETEGGRVVLQRSSFIAVFFSDITDYVADGRGFQFIWKEGTFNGSTTTTARPPTTTSTPTTTTTTTITTPTTTTTTTSTPTTTTTTEGPPGEITTCGGIIEGQRGVISYLEHETYGNNVRCAWTIRSPRFSSRLNMTKLFSGFDLGYDYLSAFGFNPDTSSSITLGKSTNLQETKSIHGTVIVLVFTSNSGNSGTGFRLEFEFDDTPMNGVSRYTDINTAETDGNFTIGGPTGNYGNNQLSVFVISHANEYHTGITMELSSNIYRIEVGVGLDPCGWDGLRVYTVGLESLSFFGKYCSRYPETIGPFLARNLYILVFASDGSVDTGGFSVFWRLL